MSLCRILDHDAGNGFVCRRCAAWVGPPKPPAPLAPHAELAIYAFGALVTIASALILAPLIAYAVMGLLGLFGFEFVWPR